MEILIAEILVLERIFQKEESVPHMARGDIFCIPKVIFRDFSWPKLISPKMAHQRLIFGSLIIIKKSVYAF